MGDLAKTLYKIHLTSSDSYCVHLHLLVDLGEVRILPNLNVACAVEQSIITDVSVMLVKQILHTFCSKFTCLKN